jgi:hypothetical protein
MKMNKRKMLQRERDHTGQQRGKLFERIINERATEQVNFTEAQAGEQKRKNNIRSSNNHQHYYTTTTK